jgi:hypothetical protein
VKKSTGPERAYKKQKIEMVLEEGIPKFYFEDEKLTLQPI